MSVLYSTVVIDPPWRYSSPGWLGGAERHYETLPFEAFEALPINMVANEDAHLWMWTTDSHLEVAFDLIKVWGFERRATFPWIKLSPKRIKAGKIVEDDNLVMYETGVHKLQYGNGYYGRSVAEFLILAPRGKNIVVQEGRHVRKVIFAPVGQHSEKPRVAYDVIRNMSPGPRIDLFGRSAHVEFDSWGREATKAVNFRGTHSANLDVWSKWAEMRFQRGQEGLTNNAELTKGEGEK